MHFQQRGLTLTELLFALGVVGVGLSLAVPGLQSAIQEHRRTAVFNEFVSTIHLARSEAVKRNGQVTLCPSNGGERCEDAEWNEGWLVFADRDQNRQRSVDEPIVSSLPGVPSVTIQSEEFEDHFAYRPNGRIQVDTTAETVGQFTFCDARGADFARVLIITVSGQPRLSDEQRNGAAPTCPKG